VAILKIEEISSEGGVTHLTVEGEIDLDTVSILRGKLDELKDKGVSRLILDFGDTRYVNSSALAVLVKFAETFREQGGGIALARVSPRVKLVFEMLGLLVFFKFFDTVEAAKSAFPAGAQG
jgi:anti-sigma B factor antagonist